MSPIKAVVLDLDGTLLSQRQSIHPKDVQAVATLHQNGVKVLIATGRHLHFVEPYIDILGADTVDAAITLSGAIVYDLRRKQRVCETAIPVQTARDFIDFLDEKPYIGTIYTRDMPYYRRQDPRFADEDGVFYMDGRPLMRHGAQYLYMDEYRENAADPIYKFAILGVPVQMLVAFKERFSSLSLCIYYRSGGTFSCEAMAGGVNKIQGLDIVARGLGFSLHEALAVGDSNNDLDVFAVTGHAAVPANAQILADGTLTRQPEDECALLDGRHIYVTADNNHAPLAAAMNYFKAF